MNKPKFWILLLTGYCVVAAILPPPLFAQSATSETCVTKVGNPPSTTPSPGPLGCSQGGGSTSSNDFVRTAEDIKSAFQHCEPPGTTYDKPGLGACLFDFIKGLNYSDAQIQAFASRYPGTIVGGCTQCLGYVGLVAALSSGVTDGSKTLAAGDMWTAGVLNQAPYGPNGFPVGNDHYAQIGTGIGAKIQSGDIAVAGTAGNHDHIGIVYKTIDGDDTHMYLLESNGGYDCKVTDDRGPVAKDGYTYYRKQ